MPQHRDRYLRVPKHNPRRLLAFVDAVEVHPGAVLPLGELHEAVGT